MTSRTKAVLWILFVFMVGGVFGGTLTYLLIHPAPFHRSDQAHPRQGRRKVDPERRFERMLKRISDAVELDDEQRPKLRQILEESRVLYRTAADEAGSRHREIRLATRQKIRSILRPDQIEPFEDFVRRRDQRFEKMHPRRRPR